MQLLRKPASPLYADYGNMQNSREVWRTALLHLKYAYELLEILLKILTQRVWNGILTLHQAPSRGHWSSCWFMDIHE